MAQAPRYDGIAADAPVPSAARAIVRASMEATFAPLAAVLRGDDVRAVHDMRVALRRTRTALATFSSAFPKRRARAARDALRRIARRLGVVRDADVHLAVLRGTLGGASSLDRPGIAHAIEALLQRRRSGLAALAIELSQFDRSLLTALDRDDA